jgi:hypothetical protein
VTGFGDLRSAAQRVPGPDAWRALCRIVQRYDEESFHERALPYLTSHLGRWPDALRCAPRSWLLRAAAGEDVPELAIALRVRFPNAVQVFDGDLDFADLEPFALPFATDSSIHAYRLNRRELTELLSAHGLARARHLELPGHGFDDADAYAIARAPLTHLTSLDLSGNVIGGHGARSLADAPPLATLTALSLARNALGPDGARALATASFWPTLTALDLSDCLLDGAAARALGGALARSSLTRLDLSFNGDLRDHGVVELARSPGLAQLTHLDLRGVGMGEAGALELSRSPHLRNLERLDLTLTGLSGPTIAALFETERIPDAARAGW